VSRKDALKKMSSLVGNAAAHRALNPDSAFSIREAMLYEAQAEQIAEMKTWNADEKTFFRERALRYASNIIKKQTRSHRGRTAAEILKEATAALDKFISEEF